MQIDANLGFAAANNIGIRIALAQPEAAYIWLLNNDTVVRPNALSALIDRTKHDSNVGLCGSTLLFYDRPEYIQACGGARYNPWTSRGGHIAAGQEASSLPSAELVEKKLRYIVGASILASRAFVEVVGLMNENYFLYCEEVDWATRAKGRFSLAYAPKSVVYHKVGASIGSAARSLYQSEMADFWGTRNRVAFTREHHWYALPTVYCFVLASAALRFLHGRAKNGVAVMLGAFRRTIPQRWDVAGRPLG
ncbi:MAG TPA: glycosyltransferase family 2 protein [Acidisarcina sp.]